jgi:hypothetical protein
MSNPVHTLRCFAQPMAVHAVVAAKCAWRAFAGKRIGAPGPGSLVD